MRITEHNCRWGILFFTCYIAGCSGYGFNSSRNEEKLNIRDNTIYNCANVGPLSCDISPNQNLTTGACAQLRDCFEVRQIGDLFVDHILACDTPVLSVASQFGSAAAVVARLDVNGPPSHGAYLFVRFKQGWCPVDQLLVPAWNHGGYCETQFQFRWEHGQADSQVELYVMSERICHMPLDQEEIAVSESDIAMSECQHVRYLLNENKLKKLSQFESEGPCQSW